MAHTVTGTKLDSEQRKVVRAIQREAKRRGKLPKHLRNHLIRAAIQTGLVEQSLRHRPSGHGSSKYWRQETAESYPNVNRGNLKKSVARFFDEAEPEVKAGRRSYEAAANVQRPREDLRYRYREHAGQAEQIRKAYAGKRGGKGGGKKASAGGQTLRVPGIDRSDERQALKLAYLQERGRPDALLRLAVGLRDTKDTPGSTLKIPGSQKRARRGSGGGRLAIRAGGGWGGARKVANPAISIYRREFGGEPSSRKRSSDPSGIGTASDHHVGNPNAYAVDLPAAGGKGDKLARRIARHYGIPTRNIGTFNRHTIKVGGQRYSVQLLWRVGGHFDHVHLGVRRA